MVFNKLEITAMTAHFKKPLLGKLQQTYIIPNPSTVVGILKNIYGKHITDFAFGYVCYSDGISNDIQRIYKEINLDVKSCRDKKRFLQDVCNVQYLINPRLIIYTDIDRPIELEDTLNLGKTSCLAKLRYPIQQIELVDQKGVGYNQWTSTRVEGGVIERTAIETIYNPQKGFYDLHTALLRRNEEFEFDKFYDEEEKQNIFLWKYEGEGKISAYEKTVGFKN